MQKYLFPQTTMFASQHNRLFALILSTLILMCILVVPTTWAQGEGPELKRLNYEVIKLFRKGEYALAVPLAKISLQIAEKNTGANHPDVAISLNNLALLYKSQGQYKLAEPLYKRALAIFEKALDPSVSYFLLHENARKEVLHNTEKLMASSLAMRKYTEANIKPLLAKKQKRKFNKESVLAFAATTTEILPSSVATTLNNLANLYIAQGQYKLAEPMYKRALAIKVKALGPNHPRVATSLSSLASLYRKTNRLSEAKVLEKRAKAIRAIKR